MFDATTTKVSAINLQFIVHSSEKAEAENKIPKNSTKSLTKRQVLLNGVFNSLIEI